MKNGKIPPGEDLDDHSQNNESVVSNINQTTIVDNLTESESLEQDGVLVVNIATDNILNLDELFPNIQLSNYSNKIDEITNKIQSNSREINGDNNNLKFKDLPENITVAPAPTNGVLPTNDLNEENEDIQKADINKTSQELHDKIYEANDLPKPTESLQSIVENTHSHRRRRRRHGNGRR